ncbi:MAG: hypothetical protein ABI768_01825 [Acidobacteriota bacterium]
MSIGRHLRLPHLSVLLTLGLAAALLGGCHHLQPIDTTPAKTVLDKIATPPTEGGLDYRQDNFFESDAGLGLGSAWLMSGDLKHARLFLLGLNDVKVGGSKTWEILNYVVKRDASIDVGVPSIFDIALTDKNAVSIVITRRSLVTSFTHEQLRKWASDAAPHITGDVAYFGFVGRITENVVSTEEFTEDAWKGNSAVKTILVVGATYGSSRQLKSAKPVLWVGLLGCRWMRHGPNGEPALTQLPPENFREELRRMGVR